MKPEMWQLGSQTFRVRKLQALAATSQCPS
nr:MAG TPA: hypothetical protein [Caudoviricetes sp.]